MKNTAFLHFHFRQGVVGWLTYAVQLLSRQQFPSVTHVSMSLVSGDYISLYWGATDIGSPRPHDIRETTVTVCVNTDFTDRELIAKALEVLLEQGSFNPFKRVTCATFLNQILHPNDKNSWLPSQLFVIYAKEYADDLRNT